MSPAQLRAVNYVSLARKQRKDGSIQGRIQIKSECGRSEWILFVKKEKILEDSLESLAFLP